MIDTEKQKLKEENELVEEVYADFKRRQEERRVLERGWQLNMNFLNGNQYCDVNALGEIEPTDGDYYWQERRVFNYIAPTIDTRCCKLTGIRPRLAVRAASEDDEDRRAARLASQILSASGEDCNLDAAVSTATTWSETCGTSFYKVIWDASAGNEIGKTFDGASVREGKVKVLVVSPLEIYPDSLSEENLYSQPSIIHARAVPAEDIYAAYGVEIKGRDIDDFAQSPLSVAGHSARGSRGFFKAVKHGYETVIERYVRPNSKFPDGRLTIVAGGKLLYDGELPYINGENGERTYPFVRQCCLPLSGGFFGTCIVDRLIPVQRAYNAVKNRKHEFLNRIAMGTLAVEEGSVDTDELAEDGLVPGKILIYRQGGTPPEMLTLGTVPSEFTSEEERLEEEFCKISGTSDITQNANAFTSVTSATGLQLIIEQDEARLNVCYEQIKSALKIVGRFILRLYKQFASSVRLVKYAGKNNALSILSFKGSDIMSDDVVLEADSDINMTPARRRGAIYDMLDKGLFSDADGKVSQSVKVKLLESLGYNGFLGERDMTTLHRQRCAEENDCIKEGGEARVREYDDHALHIAEHTAYLLSEKLTSEQEERICAHLAQHKKIISEVKNEG
ncbi:MAG: hypothetical protein K2N47_00810 [Clostridia bacterium]|nr:hypothetical protein [Clostridia bacterium]